MRNKLIIAGAGSGKTSYIIEKSMKLQDEKILITTFTEANAKEIKNKIIKLKGYVPSNIVIQTWFSFLLEHGVRPYQDCIIDEKIEGMLLVNGRSGVKYTGNKFPVYYKESENPKEHYLSNTNKIYSDKISKYVFRCNELSEGRVTNRLEDVFSMIFIDEIQDLTGYDYELIQIILKSNIKITMVGDPRQVTYSTHYSSKNKKYKFGKIEKYIKDCCSNIECKIDCESFIISHRNNEAICNFANKLYPDYKGCKPGHDEETGHDGVFLIDEDDVDLYLTNFKPTQLRYNSQKKVNPNFPVYTYGNSKGLTKDRVIIYPTKKIKEWLINPEVGLKDEIRAKFYVAITRAKYSVAIVHDFRQELNIAGLEYYKPLI